MYPTNQFSGIPMQSYVGEYNTMGEIRETMMTQGVPQQLSMMQQYVQTPMFNKSSPAPAASMAYSTRITGDANSVVYYHDGQNNQLNEHSVRQMITADGTVFVEHIPGYSLVYVPNNRPAEQILGMDTNTRASNGSSSKGHGNSTVSRAVRNHKPKIKNAFILYRSFKYKELRKKHPEMNQTDISRLVGKLWGEELEEVKSKFYEEYRKQKVERDNEDPARFLAKRTRHNSLSSRDLQLVDLDINKRHKGSVSSLELDGGNGAKSRPQTSPPKVHEPSIPHAELAADSHHKFDFHNGASLLNTSLFEPSVLQPVPVKQQTPCSSQQTVFTDVVSSALSANDNSDLANTLLNSSMTAVASIVADASGILASVDTSRVTAASAMPASSVLDNTFYNNLMDMPLSEPQTNAQW
ncbi:hypothetical protein BX667DRAFT_237854 [Coemansia mojavensis]|nr:hypothetical protein BX667DRAFT_237854 [Coemansia mojavensis]